MSQMAALRRNLEDSFQARLTLSLSRRYPHILKRFPSEIQGRIVSNLIARARYCGCTWQSSIGTFAELMLCAAPNFYQERHIADVLRSAGKNIDSAMRRLHRHLHPEAWTLARAQAQDLPLFTRPETDSFSVRKRTLAAFPLALWGLQGDAGKVAELADHQTKQWGLDLVEDSALTLAAWFAFDGPQFADIRHNPWIGDALAKGRSARESVALFKLRLALDHQRFI